MKKLINLTMIATLLLLAILFNSCTKQDAPEINIAESGQDQMSVSDISVMNKILNFRDKVNYSKLNSGFKSGELLLADSAVWNLETLFNVTYGFPDEMYTSTKTDSTTISLSVDQNGMVGLDDVITKYDEITEIVRAFYNDAAFDEKAFMLLKLDEVSVANGQMEVGIVAVTGEKGGNWVPFGPDDYWWFGEYMGECDWSNPGTDAAEKIQNAVINHKPLVYPPPGYRFVYSNYENIDLFGHEYTDINNNYLMFYIENLTGQFTYDQKCLDPDEMNFHANGEQTVIYQIVPQVNQKPPNWVFMTCDLEGRTDIRPDNQYIALHHKNVLTYAFRYLVPVIIIEPPVEL